MNDKKALAKRNKKAAELGEGGYVHRKTRRQAFVRVSFYPKVALHIRDWTGTEWGDERRITKEQVDAEYDRFFI